MRFRSGRLVLGLLAACFAACEEASSPLASMPCEHPQSDEALFFAGEDFGRDSVVEVKRITEKNGDETVRFKLSRHAAKRFGVLTSRLVNQKLEIRMGDEVVFEPVLRSPLMHGEGLLIAGVGEAAKADDWAERLKPKCPSPK